MVHFLSTLVAAGVVLCAGSVSAQAISETQKADSLTEKVAEAPVQPEKKMAKRKSDAQIKKEMQSLPKNWDNMTDKEREEYSQELLEDRFILTTSNFEVISLASGMKLCTFDVFLNNHSPRTLEKMFVNYRWGEDSTYVEFGNLKPMESATGRISLAGPVCKKVTNGADYDVTTCRAEGLSPDQCRMRIFGLK